MEKSQFQDQEKILQRIFEVIREYHMIEPGMRILAGISGGADSVCLLAALCEYRKQMPFTLLAVHVEHGIRGEESLEDAAFTQELCRQLGVECRIAAASVQERAAREGRSIEEAGRMERYRIFEEIGSKWGADRIAVAHNQNDQAETMLWNLVRGSGLKGLGGICPVRDRIIRPLLFTSRMQIELLVRAWGFTWRTDRTNLETDYARNRIRLEILPLLSERLNAQAVPHIAQAASRLQEVQRFVSHMTDLAEKECIEPDEGSVRIFLPAYDKQEGLIQRELLKRAIARCGLVGKKNAEEALLPEGGQAEKDGSGPKTERESGGVESLLEEERRESRAGREPETNGRLLYASEGREGKAGPENAGLRDVGAVHLEILSRLAAMDCGKEADLPGKLHAVRERNTIRLFYREEKGCAQQRKAKIVLPSRERQFAGQEASSDAKAWRSGIIGDPPSLITAEAPIPPFLCVKAELLSNDPSLFAQIQEENKYTKWLSYDTIKSNVLLRTRQTGDYLITGTQGGRKKLKDYFIDQKIPKEERDNIWLLADGSHVLWVIGWRISAAAKVEAGTKRILKVTVKYRKEEII